MTGNITRIELLIAAIIAAMKSGLSAEKFCKFLIKSKLYSGEELCLAFLKVASSPDSRPDRINRRGQTDD